MSTMGVKSCERIKIGLLLLLVCAQYAPRSADAQSLCESCEVQVGLGGTYHYWGSTGGVVLPVAVTWSENRYELGFVRVTTQQTLHESGSRNARLMAGPYWGVSISRRWQLFERGPVKGFFGFGLAGKTKPDALSATRWDFASQLGLRFRLPGNRALGELTMRHWSNAGIRLPNHGQDFATLTIHLNSGLFGLSKADQYPVDPTFNLGQSLVANNSGSERELLP
jgi:Lipid A 3-O-deacylase (PagL)